MWRSTKACSGRSKREKLPIRCAKSTNALRFGGLLLLVLLACGRNEEGLPSHSDPISEGDGDFLVAVGGRGLSLEEFQNLIPAEYKGLLTAEEKREFLDRWVDTELLYRGAEQRGLLEDPELQRRWVQQHRDFVANAYLQKTLDERVGISESEISEFYARHRDEYAWEYRYRQIVVNSRQEAEDIHGQVTGGKLTFKRAAEKYSLDASARLGGDMGWMTRSAVPPEFLVRLVDMDEGQISDPFETTWGWTLIQFRERRESENAVELTEVRGEILRQLLVEKRRRVYGEVLEELNEAFPVQYHSETEARLSGDSALEAAP